MRSHPLSPPVLLSLWMVLGLQAPASLPAADLLITHASRAGGTWVLEWTPAGPDLAYVVQTRPSLSDGLWLHAPGLEPWPTPWTRWVDPRAPTAPAGFFRVLAVPVAERGKLLSATQLDRMDRTLIQALFVSAGIPLTALYDVAVHKLVYETITPDCARTWASGVLAVPLGLAVPLPLASYQHGTIVRTNDAPSTGNSEEALVAVAFATTGYVGLVPDYLGLGDGPGLHPYQHARSEATACVDMLRAARSFCATNGPGLNGQLFLMGYSQGGHATLALHRELETFHTNEFTITASAPMAGAYDMSGVTADDILSGRQPPNPYYFAYVLAAYQSVYALAPTLADLLAPPYDTTLPPLFQGNATGSEINAAMPARPLLILRPSYLADFQRQPNHPMRVALRDNDLYAWRPRAPLRLYHCAGDRDVLKANSVVTVQSFHSRGATHVQLIDPLPSGDHGACVMPSLLSAKAWFDSLRR